MDEMEMIKKITENESRSKSNVKRLDAVEKKQDNLEELVGTVKVLADREKRVEDDVSEIKSDVKSITAKPGKRWENIVDKALLAVITGLVAYILYKLGLG